MDTEPNFSIQVAPELEGGSYANFLSVWHTAFEFTLDFATTQPVVTEQDGSYTIPCRVVSRIKIPPQLVFQVLQALNENMTKYEKSYGEIEQ